MGMPVRPLAGPPARGDGQGTLTPALRAQAAAIRQSGDIALYGFIGDSWDGLDAATLIAQIEDLGDVPKLTVRINSPGGYVTEGLAIFNYLKDHPAQISMVVDSLSASIASLITMAGDEIIMQRGALMMIHNPWNMAMGDANELRRAADVLDKMGSSMAGIYAERSGQSVEAVQAVMDAETWFTGAEAVEAGFASREAAQTASMDAAACFDLSKFRSVPPVLSTARASYLHKSTIEESAMDEDENTQGGTSGDANQPQTTGQDQPAPQQNTTSPTGGETASAMAAARRLVSTITAECRRHNLPVATVDQIVARADSMGQAQALILDALASRDEQTPTRSGVSVGESHDSPDAVRGAIVGALAHAMQPTMPLTGKAQQYRGYGPLAMFEEYAQSAGIKVARRTRDGLARAALQTTSDFPLLLGDAANQVLLAAYQQANPTYKAISTQKNFNDFREHKFLRAGDFPELSLLGEGGEIKAGSMSESKESVSLATYARSTGLTRQALVNDSLGAFADFPGMVALRVAAQENALVFACLTANSGAGIKMRDGEALFSTDHSNIATTAAAPSVEALGLARAGLRGQKTMDGLKLNPTPKYLLVSPDNETLADQLTTAITPAVAGNVNPFVNRLQPLSDAELSGTGWYLFGDPAAWPLLVYGYLDGASGPTLRVREGWDTDGMEIAVVHDFAAGAIGTVGAYYNAGA